MKASSKTRTLACVLLVLSLCAPMLAIGAPTADRDRTAEFRALAAPSSVVLLSRAGIRHDHARQRQSASSVFTLIPLHGDGFDPGRFAESADARTPRSLRTGGPLTGRSPPAIS
jgi:hypothetical protein